VTLNQNAPANTQVNLLSGNAAAAVPASVTVLSGQNNATFSITSNGVVSQTPVTISATLPSNGIPQSDILNLNPTIAINPGQQLPLGAVNVTYPANTTVARTGGTGTGPNFTWSLTSGTLPSGLTGLSGVGANTISGTPSSVTTQPTPQFTVKVTDTINANVTALTPHSATQALSIQVDNPSKIPSASNPCLNLPAGYSGHESMLFGPYAGFLQGFNGGNGGPSTPEAVAFSMVANGTGGITSGVADAAQGNSFGSSTIVSAASSVYTVGANGQGCMTLYLVDTFTSVNFSVTLHFVLGGVGLHGAPAGVASTGRIIEFDDYSGSGPHTSGILRRQDTTAYSTGDTTKLQTRYTIGTDGVDFNNGHFALGASLSLNRATGAMGGTSEDVLDFNASNSSASNITGVTGQIVTGPISPGPGSPTTATTGRATLSITSTLGTYHFSIYIVNANEFFLLGSDTYSASFPLQSGRAVYYTSSTLTSTGGSAILHETGIDTNNGNLSCTSSTPCAAADVGIVTLTPSNSTSGSLSGSTTYTEAGSSSTQPISNNYTVDLVSGRMTLSDFSAVTYLATPEANGNAGDTEPISFFAVVSSSTTALFGVGEFQPTATYSNGSLSGNFMFGGEDAGQNANFNQVVGQATISGGTGAFLVNRDRSGPGGLLLSSPTTLNFAVNADGTLNGIIGTAAFGVTNGTKLFEINPTGSPAIIRTFEQQ